MKNFREELKKRRLIFDGGTGTCLQAAGLIEGEAPENWSLTHPDEVTALHRRYLEAGCDIIKANTFGINSLKYDNYAELISASLSCAKKALEDYPEAFLAYDIGPIGRLLEPMGDLPFDKAAEIFADSVKAAEKEGCDLILIETMTDCAETKAAVIAAKENSSLPIVVTNAYSSDGKTMTGASAEAMCAMLEGLGVDAMGANCSFGPDMMIPLAERMLKVSSVPIVMNPNAGLPYVDNGITGYDIDEKTFAEYAASLCQMGVGLIGGCCGTTPEYIKATAEAVKNIPFAYPTEKDICLVSAYADAVEIGRDPILIGERINPTGKPKLKEALRSGNISYILEEAVREENAGVRVLDVNVGLPDIDEPMMMKAVVKELQTVTSLPLQIDSSDPEALESAMRIYIGKPLINSVNGERSKLDAVLPLVKKYGGAVVALTMDENGIPNSARGRADIALRIASEAEKYGIKKCDIIVDPLALSVSADKNSARITLDSVKLITELGFRTVLGVSNISFGLPHRDKINSTFFAQALENGLSAAIMNPFSGSMTDSYYAFRVLNGLDEGCKAYISYADVSEDAPKSVGTMRLKDYIVKGLKKEAAASASAYKEDPLGVINTEIIPALNEVGVAFEEKKAYLPQLLASAEAATAAFSELKRLMPSESTDLSRAVILATVKGDIHDIGKNIVKVLLESYGFKVYDLGRDVPSEKIAEAVREYNCRLVGLSALMTTTVPAMAETIALLKRSFEHIRVMVGGAVLTEEYAAKIGADKYCPDGIGAVRYAEEFYS